MATLTLELDRRQYRRLVDRVQNPRDILTAVGALVLAENQQNFRAQSGGGKPWMARSTPNIAGLISDFNAGRNPPSRRFSPRPALVDTGRLRQSLTFAVQGSEVNVGTSLQYAPRLQEGGVERLRLTAQGRQNLGSFLARRRDLGARLGFLLSPRRRAITIRIPPRTIVGMSNQLLGDVLNEIADVLVEGL